jgi:hypothetical protein
MAQAFTLPGLTIMAALVAPFACAETLAEAVRADALRLQPQIEAAQRHAAQRALLLPAPLRSDLVSGLQIFGLNAARLAADLDSSGGASDLRCIFRGMAEETDVQLNAIASAKTGAQQAEALRRLSGMLRDATEIAPALAVRNTTASRLTASHLTARQTDAAGTGVQAASNRCAVDPDF